MNEYLNTGLWDPTGNYGSYWSDIVPVEESPTPSRPPAQTQTRSYEEPWYVDTINRAIERASQVATVDVGGYPPYPSFPSPQVAQGVAPHPQGGVTLSTNTLLILGLVGFAFIFGRRR